MRKEVFLLGMLLILFASFMNAQTVVVDGYVYALNERNGEDYPGEATFETDKNSGVSYSGAIVIPSTIEYGGSTYTVTAIADDAFKGNSKVTSLYIPSTVKEIGSKAFFHTTELVEIQCHADLPPELSTHPFHGMDASNITLIIHAHAIDEYAAHPIWGQFVYDPADDNLSAGGDSDSPTITIKTDCEIFDNESSWLETPILFQGQDEHDAYNEYNIVIYIRNFKNTEWQPLYVPLEFVYDDWKDNFEIAKIKGIQENDNEFYAIADIVTDATVPHGLYLIRAKTVGEHSITVSQSSRNDTDGDPLYKVYTTNRTIGATEPNIAVSESFTSERGTVYTFTGQYVATPLKEIDHTQAPYRYAMSGGALKRPNPSSESGIPLGTFRWWLEVTPGVNHQMAMINSARIKVEDDVTPVDDIVVDLNKVEGLNLYYDLSGRVVEKPSNGIYIHKGKKMLVK